MTSKQLKRSKDNYIYEIAAEALTKESQQSFTGNAHTDRGNELESEAIAYYEFTKGVDCERAGLCLPFEGAAYGASPDALINREKGLEIKAPELKVHLKYMTEGVIPDEYLHQVYGSLFVSGYESWDFMSYHTDFKPFIVTANKSDEAYQKWAKAFDKILNEFLTDLEKIINQAERD